MLPRVPPYYCCCTDLLLVLTKSDVDLFSSSSVEDVTCDPHDDTTCSPRDDAKCDKNWVKEIFVREITDKGRNCSKC